MKQRKDGRWAQKVSINGKTKWFYSSANTERKADAEIRKQIAEYQEENHKEKHNFEKAAYSMMAIKEKQVGFKTYESYDCALKHLSCFFGYNIEDIRPSMVQKHLNNMANQGYSYSSVTKVKIVFGLILDHAIIQNDLNIYNYMSSIKIPKNAHKGKVKAPDDLIIETIIKNANTVDFGMWNMILLCAGLRRGEINALQKRDIDFENNKIRVWRSTEFWGNNPHLKDMPKTESSIGDVPILAILKPYLEKHCEALKPDDFLFDKTKPLTISAIRRRKEKYCKEIGYDFNLHQLRHAYAKLLYCAGVDPKTMQRLLRHADFSTTMNIYAEFDESVTNNTINIINKYMEKNF